MLRKCCRPATVQAGRFNWERYSRSNTERNSKGMTLLDMFSEGCFLEKLSLYKTNFREDFKSGHPNCATGSAQMNNL